jgi:hypothetical protein
VLLGFAGLAPSSEQAGGSADTLPKLNKNVKEFVDALVGKPSVGKNKQCTELADLALRAAGAKTFTDFGKVGINADYQWGQLKDFKDVLPGDILQLRDFEARLVIDYKLAGPQTLNGAKISGWKSSKTSGNPHHTAVVSSTEGVGKVFIVEQNFFDPDTGKTSEVVGKKAFYLADGSYSSGPETISVKDNTGSKVQLETESAKVTATVKGKIWVYRPVAKNK